MLLFKIIKNNINNVKNIKFKLYNSNEKIRENLIALFIWRDSINYNYWLNELYESCHSIDKCKFSNKFLTYKEILQEIWLSWEDCFYIVDLYINYINSDINYSINEEKQKIPEYSKNNLYDFIKTYCEWLAQKLSNRGYVTIDDVKIIINELLNTYSII